MPRGCDLSHVLSATNVADGTRNKNRGNERQEARKDAYWPSIAVSSNERALGLAREVRPDFP